MENVLQTLDPKLCIICGKHFEKGKKKDPYAQNPTVEGLQRILTLAQQRDDDVHKTLAPYTDDILSPKSKSYEKDTKKFHIMYHVERITAVRQKSVSSSKLQMLRVRAHLHQEG